MSLKSLAWLPSPTLKRNGSAFGFNPLQHWLQDAKTISGLHPPALCFAVRRLRVGVDFARAWIKSY